MTVTMLLVNTISSAERAAARSGNSLPDISTHRQVGG
jgi:hypothetical protein